MRLNLWLSIEPNCLVKDITLKDGLCDHHEFERKKGGGLIPLVDTCLLPSDCIYVFIFNFNFVLFAMSIHGKIEILVTSSVFRSSVVGPLFFSFTTLCLLKKKERGKKINIHFILFDWRNNYYYWLLIGCLINCILTE